MDLYTVGYEGERIDQWIGKLKDAGVTVLIDVRERAMSRKKGFSKTVLKNRLEANHIRYRHERGLGTPPEVRRKLKRDRDYVSFFAQYNRHLDKQEKRLHELVTVMEHEKACLMCFEKDYRQCHRSVLVERLKKIHPGKVRVEHL
ncbi:DUF488 family protein [Melghirimyces algeriensis]|uniref:DUF488 domain-containing protein n=1 Tax=Melghirimyces algeriensis TaxID=910412 RepID=A0A521F7F3_9BACL|nr:DUF488 domain-containing protein [Melghirimyces algeriensis]SMO91531.1 Protein of unknown function, DUF488 [Melghirimyces algeriensis]